MLIEATHSFPAIFRTSKRDKCVYVKFPDLDNLTIANTGTFGEDIADAYFMAQDYLCLFLDEEQRRNKPLPEPTPEEEIKAKRNERVLQVVVNLDVWKKETAFDSCDLMEES